jgi:hypothetical protein
VVQANKLVVFVEGNALVAGLPLPVFNQSLLLLVAEVSAVNFFTKGINIP